MVRACVRAQGLMTPVVLWWESDIESFNYGAYMTHCIQNGLAWDSTSRRDLHHHVQHVHHLFPCSVRGPPLPNAHAHRKIRILYNMCNYVHVHEYVHERMCKYIV